MPRAATKGAKPRAGARSILRARLGERRAEIEQAALARVKAIADPTDAIDPAYVEGLYGAVRSAVEFGVASIEASSQSEPPVPLALLAQARSAARSGVSLDTVLRRYFAGYSLLGYFLIEEASRDGLLAGAELQRLLGRQAVIFDHLLASVGEEHARESEALLLSGQHRQAKHIEGLLEGVLVDTAEIAYEFECWHVGLLAVGAEGEAAIRGLSESLDCRLLVLSREEGVRWAWLGTRRPLDPAELVDGVCRLGCKRAFAIGEPGEGLAGWRLSHRQAQAALTVAQRKSEGAVRYAGVALLAAALQDDLLATSLRQLYLDRLEKERDGGAVLRGTLEAYLAAAGSLSSAAAALGVSRPTVTNRLRRVEDSIGHPLHTRLADIETALRLERLQHGARLSN